MLEFRRATESDCAAIAEMERKYIECPWSESVLRQTLADGLSAVYAAEYDGNIVAYGGVKVVLDTAEVYNIAVDERFRRRGYGAAVLDMLCRHASQNGAGEIFLEVSEYNDAAVALYRSHGFETVYVRKNYYKSGNALVMKKKL